jgi:hypothetical protein
MIDSVTISLDRYKELESAETSLYAILSDKQKYFITHSWGQQFYISSDNFAAVELRQKLDQAIEDRDKTIKKVREFEKSKGIKVFEY